MTTMIDEATHPLLAQCTRLKIRDYRHHTKNVIDQLERLVSTLDSNKSIVRYSLKPLIDIIETTISAIDHTILWKSKGKFVEQQQLAQMACRLFKYLCQLDAECAASEQGAAIIRSILQWLRDDTEFYLTKSPRNNQDLHCSIYSCIEHYSLICKSQDEFLNELLSTPPARKLPTSTIASYLVFHRHRKSSPIELLSIVDYTVRLVAYLLESSLVTSSLLINQILTFFLTYAPIARFSQYLVNRTDFYRSILVPLLSSNNSDDFVQSVINETARSQTDSNDNVFVYVHMINLLSEFVLHPNVHTDSCLFVPTFKQLFDALVECGTTIPLWYLVKCLSNLLASASQESILLAHEMNRIGLLTSIINYTSVLIHKSTLGSGHMILKQVHTDVLTSCLSIFYNISTLDQQILNTDTILKQICRPLFKIHSQQVRLLSCLFYSNVITPKELESDTSCHHLCEQLIASIRQTSMSSDYHFYHQISLLTLVECLKKLCIHEQFKIRFGKHNDGIELLFRILRALHSSIDHQDEVQAMLESIWFLSFERGCAAKIYDNDGYFALLVQMAEVNPNETITRAARGILWQLRQTISIDKIQKSTVPIHSQQQQQQHIMLSYNHDSKDLVHQICQRLRNAGYRTWVDVDNMHGSTLDCMAHAVEQACVLIICMSEKYKQSPNCQSEAEYAYRLKKPIIPILLQSKYKPDGWLGFLLGTRLYVDFTKNNFESNIIKLINEIQIAMTHA